MTAVLFTHHFILQCRLSSSCDPSYYMVITSVHHLRPIMLHVLRGCLLSHLHLACALHTCSACTPLTCGIQLLSLIHHVVWIAKLVVFHSFALLSTFRIGRLTFKNYHHFVATPALSSEPSCCCSCCRLVTYTSMPKYTVINL